MFHCILNEHHYETYCHHVGLWYLINLLQAHLKEAYALKMYNFCHVSHYYLCHDFLNILLQIIRENN